MRTVATYFSIIGLIFSAAIILYADMFITKQLPSDYIPWAAWNDRSRFLRNIWKIIQVVSVEFTTTSYTDIINFVCLIINFYILYERYIKPSMYNRIVHIVMVYLESQLTVFMLMGTIIHVSGISITLTGLIFIGIIGMILGTFVLLGIDRREQEIVAINTDLKNFKN